MRLFVIIFSLFIIFANASVAAAQQDAPPRPFIAGYFAVVDQIKGAPVNLIIGDNNQIVTLESAGPKKLLILGYDNKTPWLKFEQGTVAVNLNSQDYYLNQSPPKPVPNNLSAQPKWEVRATEKANSWSWADRRMQWLAADPPAWLKKNNQRQKVLDWQIKMLYGNSPATVSGSLYWQTRAGKQNKKPALVIKPQQKQTGNGKLLLIVGFPLALLLLAFYTYRQMRPAPLPKFEQAELDQLQADDDLIENPDQPEPYFAPPTDNQEVTDQANNKADKDKPTNGKDNKFPPLNMIDPL